MTEKENSEFHARFCRFANRIYRGALILTGNPRSAERLQVDIYLMAFMEYVNAGHVANFRDWLARIVHECFSNYPFRPRAMRFEAAGFGETERVLLERLA